MPVTDADELVNRLVRAAERAIRAEGAGLAFDAHRLRGLTLELEIAPGAVVKATHAHISRSARSIREPQ